MTTDFEVPTAAAPAIETTAGSPVATHELARIASALCARFPNSDRLDVDLLVAGVYERLSRAARVKIHLIPLTMNLCRRELSRQRASGQPD